MEAFLKKRRGIQAFLEARGGIEPPIKVLQTFALPLGDRAPGYEAKGNHNIAPSPSFQYYFAKCRIRCAV
jgi:hypothetical protein